MPKDLIRLRKIYDKTDGYCHICHKKLAFSNHGITGAKGTQCSKSKRRYKSHE